MTASGRGDRDCYRNLIRQSDPAGILTAESAFSAFSLNGATSSTARPATFAPTHDLSAATRSMLPESDLFSTPQLESLRVGLALGFAQPQLFGRD